MTLYTINGFSFMKSSFCWQCSLLFPLFFYTFKTKFLFHFFWAQTPKPTEKNWKILKCCAFSSIWNLALSYFLNNIIQRHYTTCCEWPCAHSVSNECVWRWKVKPPHDICLLPHMKSFSPLHLQFAFRKRLLTASTLSLFPPLSAGIPLTPVCTSTADPKAPKQGHVQLSQK